MNPLIYNYMKKNMNMKKILFIFILGIFLIGIVSASLDSLGTFKQNNQVRIAQVCSDALFINISSVTYPNSSVAISNIQMSSAGSGEYFYNFTDTIQLGRYDVRGISDGCEKTFATYFEITPSGKGDSGSNIAFNIFLIIMIYTITFMGVFSRNATLTLLGGGIMMFLGVYMINNGIIIYRDDLTTYFSYLTTLIGAFLSIWASIEVIQENLD